MWQRTTGKATIGAVGGLLGLAGLTPAFGHNAICDCFLDEDETIVCEGGFSDGASAAGVPLRVYDQAGKVLVEGMLDKSGEFSFKRPRVAFRVELNAGEGHVVKIDGRDIEK